MFSNEALVLDKWFAMQAGAPDHEGDVLPKVLALMHAPRTSRCATRTARAA